MYEPSTSKMPCSICRESGHNSRTCMKRTKKPIVKEEEVKEEEVKEEEIECPICFEKIDADKNKIITPCGHQFCFVCLSESMRCDNGGNCPLCRESLLPKLKVKNEKLSDELIRYLVASEMQNSERVLERFRSYPTKRLLHLWAFYIATKVNDQYE